MYKTAFEFESRDNLDANNGRKKIQVRKSCVSSPLIYRDSMCVLDSSQNAYTSLYSLDVINQPRKLITISTRLTRNLKSVSQG